MRPAGQGRGRTGKDMPTTTGLFVDIDTPHTPCIIFADVAVLDCLPPELLAVLPEVEQLDQLHGGQQPVAERQKNQCESVESQPHFCQ